jgi:ectoine hydroxylase-related dioxygenase (phytanoyl-CoA dioxygenase family)
MGSYTPAYDQEIHTVHVPEDVRKSGKATLELVAEGAAFLHKDGIVVLDNAIDTVHVDALNAKLAPEALEIARDPNHHFNFGQNTRNMDQAPPPIKELMFKDVWCNPFAAAVLAAVLGPKPVIHYANGNTALQAPPDGRQPVHSDCEFEHPAFFPFACVVNISLVDVTAENGGTEVWPGSHHVSVHEAHTLVDQDDEQSLTIRPELLEQRRKHSPPIQAATKRGSLVIRDLRLWHAGMPNLTDEPRIMLAFVASPAWWQGRSRILLPRNVKDMVEGWSDELGFHADYVDGEVDYKKLRSSEVDFDSGSQVLAKYKNVLGRWPDYVPRWY